MKFNIHIKTKLLIKSEPAICFKTNGTLSTGYPIFIQINSLASQDQSPHQSPPTQQTAPKFIYTCKGIQKQSEREEIP